MASETNDRELSELPAEDLREAWRSLRSRLDRGAMKVRHDGTKFLDAITPKGIVTWCRNATLMSGERSMTVRFEKWGDGAEKHLRAAWREEDPEGSLWWAEVKE